MILSIIFSFSVALGIWGLYSYLDFRMKKREWKSSTRESFEHLHKRKSFLYKFGERFDQSSYGKRLGEKLQKINILLTPSEFCSMLIISGMIIVIVFHLLFKFTFFISLLIAVFGIFVFTQLTFSIRRHKYQTRLNEQLSEVCTTLANATRSGMTLNQGFQLVAQEMNEPSRSEFQRLFNELSLGVNFEEALLNFEKRMKGREYKLFIVTLLTQKRAGGNLHETLEEMAHVIDERKYLEQEIKTITSEQRFVSYIIPVIPILLVILVNTVMEDFIKVLYSGPGLILLIVFLLGTFLSFFLVKKITTIRV